MIRLKKIIMEEQEFIEMYQKSFQDHDTPLPMNVYHIYDDDEIIAFCSVNIESRGTLYLQYVGFLKEVEGHKKYKYFVETIAGLHKLGYPYISGAIHNRNIVALIWALRSGFIIYGIRGDTRGDIYVQVLHEHEEVLRWQVGKD